MKATLENGAAWNFDNVSAYGQKNGYLDYLALVKRMTQGCYILNNTLISAVDDWEIFCGEDYDEEEDTYVEIFQYFVIDGYAAKLFAEYTAEIVYYSEKLDIYLLAVDHLGTAWDYVLTDYKLTA